MFFLHWLLLLMEVNAQTGNCIICLIAYWNDSRLFLCHHIVSAGVGDAYSKWRRTEGTARVYCHAWGICSESIKLQERSQIVYFGK